MSLGAFLGLGLAVVVVILATGFLRLPGTKDWRYALSEPSVRAGKFTEAAAQAVEELHPGSDARILGPLRLGITTDGRTGELDLRPLFDAVSPLPGTRARETEKYLRNTLALRGPVLANREILLEKVLPVVRNVEFLQRSRENGQTPWNRVLAGDLRVCLAEDRAEDLVFLTSAQVVRLGGSEDALYHVALKNLAAIPRRPRRVAIGLVQGLEWDGGEPASLLLRGDVWMTGQPGVLVAAVPNRNLLLSTSTATPGGVEALRRLVEQLAAQEGNAQPLSTRLYTRVGTGWRLLE